MALTARLAALLLACSLLTLVPAPSAQASPSYWTITNVIGSAAVIQKDQTASVGATCPNDQTPVSGHVTMSPLTDVRRIDERTGFGSKESYESTLVNFSDGPVTVTPVVRCVPVGHFSGAYSVTANRIVSKDLEESALQCNGGDFGLSYEVSFEDPSSTVLYSYPNGLGFTVDGWAEGFATDMTLVVHCITEADARGLQQFNGVVENTGWGSEASATCGSTMIPVVGGNNYRDADFKSGAVLVGGRPTDTGWSSMALSLNGGTTRTRVWCMPTQDPVVTVSGERTAPETIWWNWSVADPGRSATAHIQKDCRRSVDGVEDAWMPCGANIFGTSGLPDGLHRLSVRATANDGRESIGTSAPIRIDRTPPVVAMSAPGARFTVGTSTTARWTASDGGSGLAGFDTRWRRAPYNAAFGSWSSPTALGPTARSRGYSLLLGGSTYCFATRGRDSFANLSAYAPSRCTTVPLDDRGLTRSTGWTKVSKTSWFRGTGLSTRKRGATLKAPGAIVRRVAVTALTCPSCGSVAVYAGSTRIGTINLVRSTRARRTIVLPAFSLRTSSVTVKVLTSDKLVTIDALGTSRF